MAADNKSNICSYSPLVETKFIYLIANLKIVSKIMKGKNSHCSEYTCAMKGENRLLNKKVLLRGKYL
jgi:hypothetical protein